MHEGTRSSYENRATEWTSTRTGGRDEPWATEFAFACPDGVIVDLGCGPAWHTGGLSVAGHAVVSADAAFAMLMLRDSAVSTRPVQCDLMALPFPDGSVSGAWANMSYHHVPASEIVEALRELARVLRPDGLAEVSVYAGDHDGLGFERDTLGDRWYTACTKEVLEGWAQEAGLEVYETLTIEPVLRVRLARTDIGNFRADRS